MKEERGLGMIGADTPVIKILRVQRNDLSVKFTR